MRFSIGAICLIMIAGCKKNIIEYPPQGNYGLNILDPTNLSFEQGTQYSLHAKLSKHNNLKIIFDNNSADVTSSIWFIEGDSEVNYIVSDYEDVTGEQVFESFEGSIEVDASISFSGTGTAKIEIYENTSSTPTSSKTITWS
jgi:hypothetical protein